MTLSSSGDTFENYLSKLSSLDNRINRDFINLKTINKGRFGSVVKAEHRIDGHQYAVKQIKFPLVGDNNEEKLEKFLGEVKCLSRLDEHPNIVRYYSSWLETKHLSCGYHKKSLLTPPPNMTPPPNLTPKGREYPCPQNARSRAYTSFTLDTESSDDDTHVIFQTCDFETDVAAVSKVTGPKNTKKKEKKVKNEKDLMVTLYIQMEYYPTTLEEYIGTTPIDVEFNRSVIHQIVEGLSHCHSNSVIHRDLKPTNIFLNDKNKVIIGDFGLATLSKNIKNNNIKNISNNIKNMSNNIKNDVEEDSIFNTMGVGTCIYAPYEQLHTNTYGPSVDVWALGLIVVDLYTRTKTVMERALILSNAREGILPDGFENDYPREAQIIKEWVNVDAASRPTSEELYLKYKRSNTLFGKEESLVLAPPTPNLTPQEEYKECSTPTSPPNDHLEDLEYQCFESIFDRSPKLVIAPPRSVRIPRSDIQLVPESIYEHKNYEKYYNIYNAKYENNNNEKYNIYNEKLIKKHNICGWIEVLKIKNEISTTPPWLPGSPFSSKMSISTCNDKNNNIEYKIKYAKIIYNKIYIYNNINDNKAKEIINITGIDGYKCIIYISQIYIYPVCV
eukprot:GHVL01007876.1.p1 GENE.GHVL01007876.1~~GHVL01007876.1.p1  ORF type:complete len:615 (+),score=162.34 GHVL01007876.1:149-1993(+)